MSLGSRLTESELESDETPPQIQSREDIAIKIGILSVLVAASLGVGSLVMYTLRPGSQPSALDMINSGRWSDETKISLQNTYAYLFVSIYIWIMGAAYVFTHPDLFWMFSTVAMVVVDFVVQVLVQSGRSFARLSSRSFFSSQRIAWLAYCFFLGGMTAPAFLYGIDTVRIAFHVTYVTVIILIVLSLVAPLGKYASWIHMLNLCEAMVFLSSVVATLFPLNTLPGAASFIISFYGGFILFSLYFLCHSHQAQIAASNDNQNNHPPFCPLAMSVPMMLDVISIFTRIVVMVPHK